MPDTNDPLLTRIALHRAKGVRAPSLRHLLDVCGSPERFFSMSASELHRLTGINSEIFSDRYRESLLAGAEKEAAFVRTNHITTSFLTDEGYPRRLAECDDAPVMFFGTGACNLDSQYIIGIVGTRHATAYGIDFTSHFVSELASRLPGLVVVSGLAYGIDVSAHKAALAAGVPTVGVVAHGLNMIYPATHRDVAARMVQSGGAIVTEYCTDERIHRSNFLERNRIVAGLCDCLIVVESDRRGGSMSTARIALQYNRDVFAVPGRLNDRYSTGTNRLIANNTATLLTGADELLHRMGWGNCEAPVEEPPALFRALSADEETLIGHIKNNPDCTVNDICVHLGKSYAVISAMLFQLEMDDFIVTLPGGRFATTI